MTPLNLEGLKFGRLLVIGRAENNRNSKTKWYCQCDCGNHSTVERSSLRSGVTKSCGCLVREKAAIHCRSMAKHNGVNSPEYSVWIGMRRRCENARREHFKHYGARGIKVCERWSNFANFLADMGARPSRLYSLDRYPDKDGDYEPSNCRWATAREQSNNRRSNRWVRYRDVEMTLASAIRAAGSVAEKSTARARLERGWSVERAVETPSEHAKRTIIARQATGREAEL